MSRIPKTYPSTSSIEYDTINRNGDMYILTVNITDSFNNFKTLTQRIVVKEITNNNYEISFQLPSRRNDEIKL